ncbi:MAG: selenium-dependent xanthine dehydrogenase [Eubacteriales bacterium]|nr:selenium-dependent xanthine dehydrogenase [Eubacteriales bacterium]
MCAKVILTINGNKTEAEENRRLMDVLRHDLRLTSVKDGCSEGACGTCTVLVDGKATKACVQKCGKMAGKEIVTVEGLSEREKAVYSFAFCEAGAVQCGFCIPGMVICAKALIDRNPDPNRVEIAAAIRNNYCRCTGYKKIIDAIALAACMFREDLPVPEKKTDGVEIGTFIHRVDGELKTLGKAEFCDDINIPGMIYASAVRAQYPRARVLRIDTAEAQALPGVICVLTAKDVPGQNKVGHLKQDWDTMIAEGDVTHYLGDAVALVTAENEEILEQAKALVHVEYEELPPVTCPEEALRADAPLVHVHNADNILSHEHLVRGDADEVIARSKYKVTRSYETPWTEHAFLEPECAVAMPLDDGVLVFSSDQGIYDTRHEVSIMLGIDPEKIIVENKYVGGGFGGKEDVSVQHHAALAAYLTKRVVKVKFSRKESLLVHPKRHPMKIRMTTACDENGFLTAMKAVVVADTGAYASLGGPVLQRACTHAAGPYNYQTIDIDGKAVYTNNPPAGAFRGFGVTQTCFATEMNLNLLAELCGLDPWEFRYRNAIRPGQVLPNGQIADASTGLAETLLAVKDTFYQNRYVGIGCAMKNAGVGVGLPDTGRCRLVIDSGKVHIRTGASCMGQGLATVLVHIVCAQLRLSVDRVVWHAPNTASAPDSGTTSGSRQTLVTGEACRRACLQIAADLELLPDWDITKLNGREYYGEWRTKTDKMGTPKDNPVSHIAYGYATQLCVLNEDGTIAKVAAAHDVGKAVNPKAVEGQIEGGVVMSLGYALTERYTLENCVPKDKFGTLGLFRADKTPDIEAIVIEKPGIKEAHGAIGIGEITSIPTPPAVAGAYYSLNGEFQTVLPLRNTPYARK